MLSRVSHMAMLPVITCEMNVRDQTRQASVTSSSPLCNYSCKFVHEPKKVKSTSSGQTEAFQYISKCKLLTILKPFPVFFFQKLMVGKTWRRDFVLLLNLFVCQFAIPSHAHLLHAKKTKRPFSREISHNQITLELLQQREKFVIRTSFLHSSIRLS